MWRKEYPPRLSGPALWRRQESNPGEADGWQTGARGHTQTHTNTHQSANREVWKASSWKQGYSFNCSAFEPKNVFFLSRVLCLVFIVFFVCFCVLAVFCSCWTEPCDSPWTHRGWSAPRPGSMPPFLAPSDAGGGLRGDWRLTTN